MGNSKNIQDIFKDLVGDMADSWKEAFDDLLNRDDDSESSRRSGNAVNTLAGLPPNALGALAGAVNPATALAGVANPLAALGGVGGVGGAGNPWPHSPAPSVAPTRSRPRWAGRATRSPRWAVRPIRSPRSAARPARSAGSASWPEASDTRRAGRVT